MYGHGFIPEHDHTSRRGCCRRAGVAAWSSQHDAWRIAEPVAETDAVAGAAAIRRDCDHHARGLGDGALEHDSGKVETGFPKKIILKQKDEIMIRFNLVGS